MPGRLHLCTAVEGQEREKPGENAYGESSRIASFH